ncbi:DUF1378 family protein [Escherichia coli]
MTFLQLIMLYFCTAVCVLYLLSGGYRVVRDFWRRQIDKRAAEKISASQSAGAKTEAPLIPEQPS